MRKETVEITFLTYLRPPPIAQPRVLDDEPEARVWHAGEPEEPRDHVRSGLSGGPQRGCRTSYNGA